MAWTCPNCKLHIPYDVGSKVVCSCGHVASKAKGLGDVIESVTKALGIKTCGKCKKRRDWLNRQFPYRNNG